MNFNPNMDKTRNRRKDSNTKLNSGHRNGENGRQKEANGGRPRNRTVFTNSRSSLVSDDYSRDLVKFDGGAWPNYVPRPITVRNFHTDDSIDLFNDDACNMGTTITPHGVISMRLHDRIRIDISLDRAIRIVNLRNNIILALNASGSSSGLLHPNGRIFQYGSRVEILAHGGQGNNKYAKMWYKGVSFTSDQCALVYLVDSAGTRTTTDSFSDLSTDFTMGVFMDDSPYAEAQGSHLIQEAVGILQSASYWVTDDNTDNWNINNVRVSQTPDGLVRVGRNNNKYTLRTSPSNGSASISSPYMHCTGSLGQTRHLFVRRGERRMHYDGLTFIVRNAGHSAGFDDKHQLKVY
ncbi:uncharacterized protein LOC109605575 isoform X2 [Aethina tumida]|uniref:uncharacterized protein LOC109605575 isoform X2 n=1 Tax=Aethina tumida TaxID=116153 RepID=UPI00096B5345|nr:uncharacterized protein LOC109605575 isoform X2 [Aethina tumida]